MRQPGVTQRYRLVMTRVAGLIVNVVGSVVQWTNIYDRPVIIPLKLPVLMKFQ